MRIDIENNRMLRELIDKVEATSEPIELTRGGETVATVSVKSRSKSAKKSTVKSETAAKKERAAAVARGWEIMDEVRENVKKSGLTQRQLDRLVDRAVEEVRKKNAASGH